MKQGYVTLISPVLTNSTSFVILDLQEILPYEPELKFIMYDDVDIFPNEDCDCWYYVRIMHIATVNTTTYPPSTLVGVNETWSYSTSIDMWNLNEPTMQGKLPTASIL